MHRSLALGAAVTLALVAAGDARAASLSVTPVTLVRVAPAAAGALTLTDTGTKPINVQIRVFAWRQADGAETLTPTADVVASPPMTPLAPGAHYTIRIVRIAKSPVVGEESYRVFVDELPRSPAHTTDTINLVLRYSIPVFFAVANAAPPRVAWDVRYHAGKFILSAENSGASRLQVAGLRITDAGGVTYDLNKGLVGYVLGGSTMRWTAAAPSVRIPKPGSAVLSYRADGSVTEVPVTLRAGG